MSFNCFWLQILFCSCVDETTLFSFLRSLCVKMADRFASQRYSLKNKLGDRMIKQLLNSVIAKYCQLRQIIDLRDTDKSRYFAQPRPTILLIICLCCQYQLSLSTYSINVKEKVVMAVVQSLEQSLDLSKCSSMHCHNICNSYWVSVRCFSNINPLCWAAFFTWNRASSFDINIIKLLGF